MIASDEAFPIGDERPPLRLDAGGVIRVGKSRVPLDVVVEEFENGKEPLAILREYDSLQLADIYGAIAYYLRHQSSVQTYLEGRRAEAAQLRAEIEASQGPSPTRAEWVARQGQIEMNHAAAEQ